MIEEYITREELEELRELINIANDALITWKQRAIEAEALAASRKELLRKSKLYFDWFVYEVPTDHVEGFEILLEELTKELGDG